MRSGWPELLKLSVGILAAIAVVAGVIMFVSQQVMSGGHGSVEIVPAAAPEAKVIKVYVSGAAQRPGVYPLKEGDRVEDALRAAGGPTDEADLAKVNLAALVRDELHVSIPARTTESFPAQSAEAPISAGKVDINAASFVELDKLPGVGTVTANKIIDYRQRNGPFRRPEDLRDLKLVNSATWDKIKELVVAN